MKEVMPMNGSLSFIIDLEKTNTEETDANERKMFVNLLLRLLFAVFFYRSKNSRDKDTYII